MTERIITVQVDVVQFDEMLVPRCELALKAQAWCIGEFSRVHDGRQDFGDLLSGNLPQGDTRNQQASSHRFDQQPKGLR